MNVQNMNKEKLENQDTYRSLQLLDEISKGEQISQRDLSKNLNIALGLVNSYIKNLVSKGYIKIKAIPSKRYAYFLTPNGFAEKTRLTYHLLQDYTNLYKNARKNFHKLFYELNNNGTKRVVFAGVDEVTEIAYLSLQEVDITLEGVVDENSKRAKFFKIPVLPFNDIKNIDYQKIIITTFVKREYVYQKLIEYDVPSEKIQTIYDIDTGNGRVIA
jgi:DNA-binding MarR family transcriptional regulator